MGFQRFIFQLAKETLDTKGDRDLFSSKTKADKIDAILLDVPYAKHGFENSCSECSAEMILKYWDVVGWDQFSIHKAGYQTYEGGIAEGDYGLKNLFLCNKFKTTKGREIEFTLKEFKKGKLSDLRKWIDKGVPLIVRVSPNANSIKDKHTFVITGYSKIGFIKNDNDVGSNLFLSNEMMAKQWKPPQYLVIYPKGFLIEPNKHAKCEIGGR
jgi:hypothetical protein